MRLSRRLSLCLMVSIGINLFLAGMLIAPWLTDDRVGMAGPFNREAAYAALSDDYRELVDQIWRDNREATTDHMGIALSQRRAIRQQLQAEQLDKAALEQAFKALHDTMVSLAASLFSTAVEIAAALPADERKRYFEAGFAGGRASFRHDPLEKARPPAPGGLPTE